MFRGSVDWSNWYTDLTLTRTSYSPCDACAVHEGFYISEQSVLASVRSALDELIARHPSYHIVVTGHSLGAALATLCAADLAILGYKDVQLINFGSPRLFNEAAAVFASAVLPSAVRVTHLNDVIPHTPLVAEGYMHISGEWYNQQFRIQSSLLIVCAIGMTTIRG